MARAKAQPKKEIPSRGEWLVFALIVLGVSAILGGVYVVLGVGVALIALGMVLVGAAFLLAPWVKPNA